MRAFLLQVLYSIRSERMLVEQISYDMLFRWFVGLLVEGTVRDHSTFSNNRDRMLEHGVLALLFNETVETERERGYLSGKRFSVDGTLIQAWAGAQEPPIHDPRAGAPVSQEQGNRSMLSYI